MSDSRRSNQGPRYDWAPPEAQQPQYGSQGGIDQITAGISGVSLHNSPYGHGTGYDNDPYTHEYYQASPYPYGQDGSYPSQEGGYSQPASYPAESQYPQTSQYGGEGYDFQSIDSSVDQNAQYTTDPRQQYPAQHKGKSRVVDPATTNKPKYSRDKPRERDKEYGKGKSSTSKSSRSKSGKAQWEEEEPAQDDNESATPFYGRKYAHPEQNAANLDHSRQDETTTSDAPADGPIYDDTYTTAPQSSADQVLHHEGHGDSHQHSSAYNYEDPYASNEYQGARGSGSRQHSREDVQPTYFPTLSDPYPPDVPDDIASAIAESDGYVGGGSSHLMGGDPGIGASTDYTYSGYEDGAGIQTPRAATPQATIASTVGQAELDERFIVEPSSRFFAGEVFKVLWSEPLGSGRGDMTDAETRSHLGQRFYVGIRRFIIVRTDEGHSTCVPILTYERRACTKRGVKPRTHGIIYPEGSRPRSLEGEPLLGCRPVKIELDYPSERIIKESRVNYSKLVTVEHNVKVFFIGRVSAEHLHLVNESVDKCWEYKNKLSKGDSRRHYPNYRTHR